MIDKNIMQASIDIKLLSTELDDNDIEYTKRRLEQIHDLLVAYCGGPQLYKEHLYEYFDVYDKELAFKRHIAKIYDKNLRGILDSY